ncbi:MAG: DUF2017 family protein [Cryobacterium sp.]|nr:DUF2017 family protein [Cryobacterium sp.]
MREFRLEADETVAALIELDEANVVRDLANQLTLLLTEPAEGDPALLRLLPDAYPDDAASSTEFRRYTHDSLIDRKVANASTVIETLDAATAAVDAASEEHASASLRLDRDQAIAWLTTLTDIRLTLANRLGIIEDDQRSDDVVLQDLYDWLGFVQNAIVETLES